jgi:hypothetical protein
VLLIALGVYMLYLRVSGTRVSSDREPGK